MKILITGGSGFLGGAMLPKLVFDQRVEKVFLLMRDSMRQTASERLDTIVDKIFKPSDRMIAMAKLEIIGGDLTLPGIGLNGFTRELLRNDCTHILHIGASTDFGAPLSESREINVEGTRKLLDFALECKRRGHLQRFDYVSTAFVAGTKSGKVSEDDLSRDQSFANAYEQSKYEAELLVRDYADELPITIYRPSIVVGDSRNGFTPHFKVLYWPLQLLSKNILPFVPCRKSATLDIVPVDYVAEGMYRALMARESIGRTIYLAAGPDKSVRIDRFLKDAFALTKIEKRPLIPMWVFRLLRGTWLRKIMSEDFWRTCDMAAVYNDYLSGTKVLFDNRKSEAFLKALGCPSAPSWSTYGTAILKYCTESRWGRRLAIPEFEYRNPV